MAISEHLGERKMVPAMKKMEVVVARASIVPTMEVATSWRWIQECLA